jgi:hypothetical protein
MFVASFLIEAGSGMCNTSEIFDKYLLFHEGEDS